MSRKLFLIRNKLTSLQQYKKRVEKKVEKARMWIRFYKVRESWLMQNFH